MSPRGRALEDRPPTVAVLPNSPTARRFLFAALYFSEGAPIGYLWWALPAELRAEGMPVERITALTAALALPWTFKFLWAPLIDLSGGRYRLWIVACQAAMGLALLPLALVEPAVLGRWLTVCLLGHAVAASTQDAAIDAYAIAVAPESERGSLAGAMQAGMLTGRWAFGAGLLLAGAAVGRAAAVYGMLGVFTATAAVLLVAGPGRRAEQAVHSAAEYGRAALEALKSVDLRRGLALAVLGGAAFEATGVLAGPFLIDRGWDEQAVGGFFTVTIVLMLAGSLLGGRAADRWGKTVAVRRFLVFLAAMAVGLALADAFAPSLRLPALASVYLGAGLLTASSYAWFMDRTDPRLGGAQYSLFMGGTNLCEAWAGFAGGRLVALAGYPWAFAAMAAATLAATPALAARGTLFRNRAGSARQGG